MERQNFWLISCPLAVRPVADDIVRLLDMGKSIIAPLVVGNNVIGVFSVTGSSLMPSDVPAFTTFANQVSIALQNTRLITDAMQRSVELKDLTSRLFTAQEEERRRISLEMHDELGQSLAAISYDLYNIEKALPPECDNNLRGLLGSARATISDLDEMVSDLALDLRPQMLDDLGLLPTLRWYANRYSRRTGIEVVLEAVDFEMRFTPETHDNRIPDCAGGADECVQAFRG